MRQFRVVTPPAELPVTVAQVKLDARIDHVAEDTLLAGLIAAATERAEGWARRALVTRTYELALDCWPGCSVIDLPMPPVATVVEVAFYDRANARHALTATDYVVYADLEPGLVGPAEGKGWPAADLRLLSPIRVVYQAGYGSAAAVPEVYKQLVRALAVIDYEHREGLTADGQRKLDLVRARLQADWGWRWPGPASCGSASACSGRR